MHSITSRRALAACATLALTAGWAPSADAKAKPRQAANLQFAAVAGDTPVRCGTPIEGLGTTSQTAELLDFRFYVSQVRLVRSDGRAVPVKLKTGTAYQATEGKDAVTLIDLEDGSGRCEEGTPGRNAAVRGTVPKGRYVGARFTVGVPFALNHTDTVGAAAPLRNTAMAWSWQFGRKFAKIEFGDPAASGAGGGHHAPADHGTARQHSPAPAEGGTWAEPAFLVHLGSTGCKGNPATGAMVKCKATNEADVVLERLDLRKQAIALDVAQLLAGNDITVNASEAPGCMSGPTDPECEAVFGALGIDWQADGSGRGGSPAGPAQTVFRAIDR